MKRVFFICILLAGCAERHPAVTADSVLDEQYRARTAHGVITGGEAQTIADAYRKTITALPANLPSDNGSLAGK